MDRKAVLLLCLFLLPGIALAQWDEGKEVRIKHNEFFVMGRYLNLEPINNFLSRQGLGYTTLGDNPMLYGVSTKNRVGERLLWGLVAGTTIGEGIFDMLAPNMLKRSLERLGTDKSNKAEFTMMFAEAVVEYEFLKLGSFSLSAGGGLGFGGSVLTLLGENSARFRILSSVINPIFCARYHFFEATGTGILLSLIVSYDYFPNSTWLREAGKTPEPERFDMSGPSLWLTVGIPSTELTAQK